MNPSKTERIVLNLRLSVAGIAVDNFHWPFHVSYDSKQNFQEM